MLDEFWIANYGIFLQLIKLFLKKKNSCCQPQSVNILAEFPLFLSKS